MRVIRFIGTALAVLLALAPFAFAQNVIPHNESVAASTPVNGCMFFDQGTSGGTDTKLCAPNAAGWSTAFGFGPLATSASISAALDTLGSTQGGILYRGASLWSYLAPGTSGQFLETLGAGANPLWATAGGGGGTPGGSNTQVQYNNAGSFGGSSGALFSATKLTALSVGLGSDATGDTYYNGGSGAFTRLGIGSAAAIEQVVGGIPAWSVVSGDATLAAGGALTIGPNVVTNAKIATAAANTVKGNFTSSTANVTDNSMPPCPDTGGNHLNYTSGIGLGCGTSSSGGAGTPIDFTGVAGGSSTAYTVPTLTPSTGFANTAGFRVTASFTTANGANPTLSAGGLAAKPIVTQTGTSQSPIGLNVITNPSTHGFILDASAANWIMDAPQTPAVTPVPLTAGGSVTAAMFGVSQEYDINTASQTITLPLATTVSAGGAILIKTEGVTVTLTPQSADGINGGTINTSITLPADSLTLVNTTGSSGTGAFTANVGPVQYFVITWASGQNLVQSSVNGLPLGRVATPRTIIGIRCMVNNAVGATAGFDIYSTASGTAPASGTKLNTTACNANTASNAEQDMAVASASVPAGYWIYLVATGTWSSSVGSGAVNVSFR